MVREGRSWSGYEKNCCFLNLGGSANDGQFANISAISGLDYPDDGRAVSVVDWDHDGDLDLWVRNRNAPRMRFLRNEAGRAVGDFLAVRLVGDGQNSNRDAIGARVEVTLRGDSEYKLIKTVRAGESFLSQNSKWLHFGLGDDDPEIESVVIHWPDADHSVESLSGLQANGRYVVTQGRGSKESPPRESDALEIEPGLIELPKPEGSLRVPAISFIAAPRIRGRDFSGKELVTNSLGRWTLVNFWASWCTPCLTELNDLVERGDEIREAGIRVIALSVDGLGENPGDAHSTLAALKRLNVNFEAGFAHQQFLDEMKEAADYLTMASEPLSLPMSFLLDPENRLAVMYRGRIDVNELLDDASNSNRSLQKRLERAAPWGGRTIDHQHIRDTANSLEATVMYRLGRRYEDAGNIKLASYYYRQAIAYWPDFPDALSRLRR